MRVEFLLPCLIAASSLSLFSLPSLGSASLSATVESSATLAQHHPSENAYRGSGRRTNTASISVNSHMA